jgi:hypothetical protein
MQIARLCMPFLTPTQVLGLRSSALSRLARVDQRATHPLTGEFPIRSLVDQIRTETFVSIGVSAPGPKISKVPRRQRQPLHEADVQILSALILVLSNIASDDSDELFPYSFSLAVCLLP